jgi:hypothetical protein
MRRCRAGTAQATSRRGAIEGAPWAKWPCSLPRHSFFASLHRVSTNASMSSTTLCNTARGVVRRRRRPQRRLERVWCFYLAPVEAPLHAFSLADGDFGLDLHLYHSGRRLPCRLPLAASAQQTSCFLELASHCPQAHALPLTPSRVAGPLCAGQVRPRSWTHRCSSAGGPATPAAVAPALAKLLPGQAPLSISPCRSPLVDLPGRTPWPNSLAAAPSSLQGPGRQPGPFRGGGVPLLEVASLNTISWDEHNQRPRWGWGSGGRVRIRTPLVHSSRPLMEGFADVADVSAVKPTAVGL